MYVTNRQYIFSQSSVSQLSVQDEALLCEISVLQYSPLYEYKTLKFCPPPPPK